MITHDMTKPNAKMKKARESAGLSMEALAKKAGVSLATIYRMENGIHNSLTKHAQKVAKVLGKTLNDLF